jgi:hypothetical protein
VDAIDAERRNDRLGLLLGLFRGVPALDHAEAFRASGPLTAWGVYVAEGVDDDDLALASVLLTFEAERRARGWAALERLGASLAGTDGELDERVHSLPLPLFASAAASLAELGWIETRTAA